jgi:thioredoxin reductase (NADPH)
MKMQNGAHRFGAATKYADVTAVELDGKVKRVTTSSGEVILGRVVIIATGANPRKLGVDGEDSLVGRGVHYCAHCDGRFYKDKTVVVVGGGNSAVGDAIYLARIAKKVILVHRRDTLKASKIYHSQLHNSPNVEIMWNSAIDGFTVDGRVVGVKVKNLIDNSVSDVECNGVFVSIGRTPVTEFLGGQLTLDRAGYIVADESTKTNIDGVFAAGDVRTKTLRQVVTAAADGAVAVHFADEYLSID